MTRAPFRPAIAGLIAHFTFVEAVRQRVPQVLLLGSAGLVLGIQGLREFNFGLSELKFIADLGFGAMVFFGSILAIILATQLFLGEIEERTAPTVLAKAVGRTEFVVGKFLGVAGVLALFSAAVTGLIAAMLYAREIALLRERPDLLVQGGPVRYADIAAVGFGHMLRFGVLAALSLLVASWARTKLHAVMTSFGLLVIGDLQSVAQEAYAGAGSLPMRVFMAVVALLVPDLQVFDLGDLAGTDGIPAHMVLRAAGYALCCIVAAGALAAFGFQRREL